MSNLDDKLEEYIKRISEAEGREDWKKVIDICKEYINVLSILMDSTDNVPNKNHFIMIRSSIAVLGRVAKQALKQEKINKDVEEKTDSLRTDLNNVIGRIKRIEEAKGYDNPEKMR